MNLWLPFAAGAGALLAIASFVGADWDLPPVDSEQVGYRGTGMYVHRDREDVAALDEANQVPEAPWEADPEGDRASAVYENVQVLGHLSLDQFDQFMAAITEWVSPEEGCSYCHNDENLASDEVYTKVVARRMIQMNQTINEDWKAHVADTGVTCYTCHRGQAVPANVWSSDPGPRSAGGMSASRQGQNIASKTVGSTSLPHGALESYLVGEGDAPLRVHSLTALPTGENTASIKDTEATYGLMVHMSEAMGTNCVACHNSRAFNDWDQSPPQRVTAWHGIRMARALNNDYMVGLTPVFPDERKGPQGDVLKISCATCHNGVQRPLGGVSMLQDYVDAIGSKVNTAVPDFASYRPGETQRLQTGDMPEPEPEEPAEDAENQAQTGDGGTAPAEEDAAPAEDSSEPAEEESTAPADGDAETPAEEDAAPADDSSEPSEESAAPAGDEESQAPTEDGDTAPAEEDAAPAEDSSEPAEADSAAPADGDGEAPAEESTAPAGEEPEATGEANSATEEEDNSDSTAN